MYVAVNGTAYGPVNGMFQLNSFIFHSKGYAQTFNRTLRALKPQLTVGASTQKCNVLVKTEFADILLYDFVLGI